MKRNIFLIALIAASSATLYAQNELDVYKLSHNDLTGTARSVAMGGAFGALGGDLSGVAINPAGIAVYKSSEFVTTLNFQKANTQTTFPNGLDMKDNKFKFSLNNLGYIASVPIDNEDVPRINFGFAYNRLKNFDTKYRMGGGSQSFSLTDYIAAKSYGVSRTNLSNSVTPDGFNPPSGTPWLSALGWNSYLMNYKGLDGNGKPNYEGLLPQGKTISPWLDVEEKGAIDKYDFTAGTTIADKLSIGLTLSVTDISYRMHSNYEEDLDTDNFYYLENELKTEGSGFQFNLGLIYKPVNALRLGFSYQSPTWYSMTDYYGASMTDQLNGFVKDPNYKLGTTDTGVGSADYNMRTPDKYTFSIAGVIGQTAILSADYELTNYKNMKLSDDNDPTWTSNQKMFIGEDFKAASTLRLGAEVRFTPQFSGRVGYMWQQAPLTATFKDGKSGFLNKDLGFGEQLPNTSTLTNFTLEGDANYFTYGLGYRFSKSFYTDVAFVMKSQKADLYPFPNLFFADGSDLGVIPAELKTNTFSGLLTFGFRF